MAAMTLPHTEQIAGDAALAALALMLDWGVDETLEDAPIDRLAARPDRPVAQEMAKEMAQEMAQRGGAADPAPGRREAVRPQVQAPVLQMRPSPVQNAQRLADAATTLDELRAAMAGFQECALSATATTLVFGDGNPEASVMLVGEAPGAEEDRAGLPFVGASGKLMDRMFASVGLARTSMRIANILPWRPPGNRTPTDAEVQLCLPFLLRQIVLIRPRRLVLLGALSARALTGSTQGIRQMRGRWIEIAVPGLEQRLPALPMLHPAYLLRQPGAKREAWADLIALRQALDEG